MVLAFTGEICQRTGGVKRQRISKVSSNATKKFVVSGKNVQLATMLMMLSSEYGSG